MSDTPEKKRNRVRRVSDSVIIIETEADEVAVDLTPPLHCTHVQMRANGPLYQFLFYYLEPLRMREGNVDEGEIELPMVFANPAAKVTLTYKAIPGLIKDLQKLYKFHEEKEGRLGKGE